MPEEKEETTRVKKHGEEEPSPHPDEEQGIEQEKHGEEEALEMELGEKEEDVYDETGREKLTEDAEIEPREEGFAEGYEERGELSKCANCRTPLSESSTIEREINGELVWFCSDKCVEEYLKTHKKEEESHGKKEG